MAKGQAEHVAKNRDSERASSTYWDMVNVTVRLADWELAGFHLKAFRIVPPKQEGGDWFCACSALTEDGDVVGFTSAPSLEECVRLVCVRLANGSMKWNEDKYAKRE